MGEPIKKEGLTGGDLRATRDNPVEPETLHEQKPGRQEPGRPLLVKTDAEKEQLASPTTPEVRTAPLFSDAEIGDLRGCWSRVQADFVDQPRRAVQEADKLVADLTKRLIVGFAGERSRLEKQWDRGDEVSTEALRVALQRYRSFFDRLLKA